MRKLFTLSCILTIAMSFSMNKTFAQGFISFSKFDTASGSPQILSMQVVNGETYTLSLIGNYEQIGQYPQGLGIVTKLAADGSVIYSTPLGSDTAISYLSMKVINGEVFVLGGQFYDLFGLGSPIIIARLHTNGSIAFVKYLETSGLLTYLNPEIQIVSDEILLNGTIGWIGNPITIGNISSTGTDNINFLAKISTSDGEITRSMFVPFYLSGTPQIEAGAVYLAGSAFGASLPITIGNVPSYQDEWHIYIQKINFSDFNTVYARYFADSVVAVVETAAVLNGELRIAGRTRFNNFPVTNSSTGDSTYTLSDWENAFYVKLNADGSLGFSTFMPITGTYTYISTYVGVIKISNGFTYINGRAFTSGGTLGYLYKFDANNALVYSKIFTGAIGSFEVINDEVYAAGSSSSPTYPVTNGSQYSGGGMGFFTRYGAGGNILFSTFLNNSGLLMKIDNNKIYLSGITNTASISSTDSSNIKGAEDNYVIVLKPDGTKLYCSYIGGTSTDMLNTMQVNNDNIYICGYTLSSDYPVTDNVTYAGNISSFLTKLSFCPTNYATSNDTLQPKIQTVCKYGLADSIRGQEIIVPGDSLPRIFLDGVSTLQRPIGGATYQWQVATALTGPWTDIPNATSKNYRPVIGAVDQYYRRNAFLPEACGVAVIHTSDTSTVIAGPLTAPALNAGGPFATCPSVPIVIGGSPTVTGGNPPYVSYNWDMGIAAVSNPTVSPLNNTVYTLTVTDSLGCKQMAQAVVLVYKANAGSNKNACASPVVIGSAPVAGLPGVIYSWNPSAGLNSTALAQPFAQPSVQMDYDLTLTIPKSGGGTCTTYDTVTVIPIAAPINPNFAGADQVICLGTSASIGSADEPGFVYAWSPPNYLSATSTSSTVYNPGLDIPTPDPATLQLSAYKNGCTFSDAVTITTIVSDAGPYCPNSLGAIIGSPDVTPNINETYSWVKISGPGNFTGATNLPQVPVGPSPAGTTTYGLTVSYNGTSCYSETINSCSDSGGSSCISIGIYPIGCPGYSANNGVVSLHASSIIPDAIYTWMPAIGLNVYTGNTVQLTDTIVRTYTVTATNAHDSSIHCSASITTNLPNFVAPIFAAPDTVVCAGEPVIIGLPPMPDYTYEWSGQGLNNYFVSNPIATLDYSTEFHVLVTNADGCTIRDTVIVTVQNTPAYAGEDWLVCSNASISLGTDSIPSTSYLWEPQSSNWQNGTNQFSALPQVLVATNVTYALTTTTTAGCISTDSVQVTVNNSPTIPNAPDVVSCTTSGKFIGSPALPGVTYLWSPATGLDNPTAAQPYAMPAVTTTYTVVATFPGSCGLPATDQVTVTVNDPSFHMPDIHFCPVDGPVALGVNAPAGMAYYQWYPYDQVTDYLAANPSTLGVPGTTTIFNLYVQNSFGCSYTDTLAVIPYTDVPNAGASRTACKGNPISIGSVANPTGPTISYSWSPSAYLDNPSSPNPLFTGTLPGTFQYVLTKTDNSIPCSATDTIVITVVDILPLLDAPTVCRNSCVQIGTAAITGINYVWSPAIGLSNPYISNPIACIDSASTTFILTASDQSGCTTSTSIVIGVNAIPGVQASIPDVVACVGDTNVMLVPSAPPGSYSYLWSPDDGTLSNVNIANPFVQTVVPGTAQYNLQITDHTTQCTNTITGNVTVNTCSTLGQAGNFLWFDTNGNGIQDSGEPGVSGQAVRLFNNVGFNVATSVTDANGLYDFASVSPGAGYYIIFNKPAGYEFTLKDVGGISATNNSKADANGRTDNFDVSPLAVISYMDAGIKPTGSVPISLLSFTARLQNNKTVLLNWQTTAEINNHYFDVERSNDGISFTAIGRVNGHGTSSLPHSYSLIDPDPLTGFNYYRLRQVDFDGHFTFSNVEVIELKKNEPVTAWYNNQNNSIQLSFNSNHDNLKIKLYASNGQLIKSEAPKNNMNSYTLNLPVLSTGVYMLQVVSEKMIFSKKIFIGK